MITMEEWGEYMDKDVNKGVREGPGKSRCTVGVGEMSERVSLL